MQKNLHRFSTETDYPVEFCSYLDAEHFLSDYPFGWDLVIMDIDMLQYALAGYEVEAVDHVLKSVAYQDFILKFRKALRYIRRYSSHKRPAG